MDVLGFLRIRDLPFINNRAEQDDRMMEVKQKIAGGFRSPEGTENSDALRRFFSTAKKQGWNIIPALMEDPDTLISHLRPA